MSAPYAYTPQIWPPLLTIIVLIVLAVYALRQRQVPGALPFAIGCLIAVFWAFGTLMEVAAASAPTRIAWLKLQAVSQLPSITAVALFILEYVWPGRGLTRRNVVLLSIPPLLLLLVVLLDPVYHLMWRGFAVNGDVLPIRAPLGWAFIAYGYLLGLLEMAAFLWLFVHSPRHRWPVAIMLFGQISARIIYLIDQRLDLFALVLPMTAYSVALFAFRILDANALARETAFAVMRDGMLVLDPSRHVASLNPAAQAILGLTQAEFKGRAIDALLPGRPKLAAVLDAAAAGAAEVSLGTAEARYYELAHSPLRDARGLPAGELFLLQDVTEQRRAQAQLVEQQRALATLQEREQLARELHDSIGQVLGYAGLQTDMVGTLIERGQAAEARLSLQRLAGVLRDAHADVRQQILDLRASPSPQVPVCDAIRGYLQGYTANYGITAALEDCADLETLALAPDTQTQLFRILQEALTNVRKHSDARRVRVSLQTVGDTVRMRIADDGHGFDPTLAASVTEGHLGLSTMRERAEHMAGRLEIESGPGGTTLTVTVPGRRDDHARIAG
jgi:PAS domain S-box-containing protein